MTAHTGLRADITMIKHDIKEAYGIVASIAGLRGGYVRGRFTARGLIVMTRRTGSIDLRMVHGNNGFPRTASTMTKLTTI